MESDHIFIQNYLNKWKSKICNWIEKFKKIESIVTFYLIVELHETAGLVKWKSSKFLLDFLNDFDFYSLKPFSYMINLSFPHYARCRYTTTLPVLISSCIVTLMSVNNYYLQLLIQPLSFYYANCATLFKFGVQIYNFIFKRQ